MRDFTFSGYGFSPFGKRESVKGELSLQEQLRDRLEEPQVNALFTHAKPVFVVGSSATRATPSNRQ